MKIMPVVLRIVVNVLFSLSLIPHITARAQSSDILFFSMDNDLFSGKKQDGAYTNGLQIDYYHQRRNQYTGLLSVYQIGVSQIMITPNDISDARQHSGDYPYSGSLFLRYSKATINPYGKRSIAMKYLLGVLGPYSFAEQTQTQFHKLIRSQLPQGWASQLETTLMVNVNCVAEIGVFRLPKSIECLLQSELDLGTAITGASLQAMVRTGKMTPYFQSFTDRYVSLGHKKKFHCYGYTSLKAHAVVSNTLLTGKICNNSANEESMTALSHMVLYSALGVNASYSFVGLSFVYKTHSGLIQGQGSKAYGTIALSFRL